MNIEDRYASHTSGYQSYEKRPSVLRKPSVHLAQRGVSLRANCWIVAVQRLSQAGSPGKRLPLVRTANRLGTWPRLTAAAGSATGA